MDHFPYLIYVKQNLKHRRNKSVFFFQETDTDLSCPSQYSDGAIFKQIVSAGRMKKNGYTVYQSLL
jgi:hypothetical protein